MARRKKKRRTRTLGARTGVQLRTGYDMDGDYVSVGSRVEISPHFDLWMRGAKYGTITRWRGDKACVRMDNQRVRRLFCAKPVDLKRRR